MYTQWSEECEGEKFPLEQLSPVEIGAAPDSVVGKVLQGFLVAVILRGIRPQQVTHGTKGWRLLKPV